MHFESSITGQTIRGRGLRIAAGPRVLAYFSITPGADEPYFSAWSCRQTMSGQITVHAGDERNECALDELVAMIAGHLRKARPDKSVERARES
jgi:hypothetical protein